MPFTRTPALAMEYSNLGYALLGRIVANVSGPALQGLRPAACCSRRSGMASTGYDVAAVAGRTPRARLSLGRRRLEARADDGARRVRGDGRHPDQRHRLREVGRVSALRLAGRATAPTPGRCGASSVRELAQGANFPACALRGGATGADACRLASTYAMGFIAAADCELGLTLSHGGGYPGYGSHVLLLPDYGVGIFALRQPHLRRAAPAGLGRGGGAAPRRRAEAAPDRRRRRR